MKTFNLFRMSVFIPILLILSVFPILPVAALDWYTANQATAAWDAVTLKNNGAPLDANDTIEYSVYLTDSVNPLKDSTTVVWRGSETQTIITMTDEWSLFVGVRAHRIRDGTEITSSVVSWSDNPLVTNSLPWGLRFFFLPATVQNLRKE